MRYKPKSTREIGLKTKLDRETKEHNNLGYAFFEFTVSLLNRNKVSVHSMAALFGVIDRTYANWVAIYRESADGHNNEVESLKDM